MNKYKDTFLSANGLSILLSLIGFRSSNWYMTILKRDRDRHKKRRRRWGRRRR